MKNGTMMLATAIAVFLPTCGNAQELRCLDIASALKEFSIHSSSVSYTNSVFDSYCEANGSVKQSSGSVGLEAVVKSIPFKFTAGATTNEEKISNFCRTYASSASLQERSNLYEERIAGKSLDAVTTCLSLQAQGVTITHRINNRKQADFFLKSSVDIKLQINGVSLDGPVTCSGNVAGAKRQFNENTALVIQNSQSFTCTRTPRAVANNPAVYDEAVVTVATQKGNYSLVWPRDERLPENMAVTVGRDVEATKGALASLSKTVEDQRRQIDALAATSSTTSSAIGNMAMVRWKTGNNGTASCDEFCGGTQWGGYSARCVAALIGSAPNYVERSCSYIHAKSTGAQINTSCLCVAQP